MGEINSAQYSSVFPRFLLSLGFHPLGEDAKSCESPWLLVETAFFTPLSVDLGYRIAVIVAGLVFMPGGAASWGGPPPNNDPSDVQLGNTAGGTDALSSNTAGRLNTAFGEAALPNNTSGNNNTAFGYD